MNDNSRLDKTTYDSSRKYLKAALEHMLETGRSVRELSEFALDKFGADFLPYLRQFLHEVGHGRIVVKGLSRTAQSALSSHTVSSEDRERMVREAAYLRAERRGFCGGSAEQDWLDAEYEVDTRLAQGERPVAKGGRALAAVVATVEKELAGSKQVVTRWLDRKFPARKAAGGRNKPAARKAGARSRTSGAASGAAESRPKKKKVIGKNPDKGSAAKKTAATKPSTKKQTAKKAAVKKKSAPGRSAATGKAVTASSRKKAAAKKQALPATRKKTSTKKRAASSKSRRS